MIRSIFSLLLVFFVSMTMAQKLERDDRFQQEWYQIDSLIGKGLPQSAAEIAREILAKAQRSEDDANAIKAQLFLMSVDEHIQVDADIHNIRRIDSIAKVSEGPEKALWQSIGAELHWQYYQRNRWSILNRTPVAGEPSSDISTWDATALIRRITELYRASVAERELLKAIPVERYAPIVIEGKNTRHLRPTLFDFLAFRALDFFQNDEKDVTRPAYQFQIDGTLWFEPAARFGEVKVNPADPEALHFQALRLYQELIAFHLNDRQPDALIDADLHRLSFVYQHSVHPDKDSLFLHALKALETRHADSPASAQVTYRIIQLLYDARLAAGGTEKPDLPALKQQLDALISRWPNTEGAINAAQLRHTLLTKSLEIKTEQVVLPGENSKALLTYRNLDRVYLRIYKAPPHLGLQQRRLTDMEQAKLLETTPIRAWEQQLPGVADLNEHRTELKIEPLPIGGYIVVAAAKPEMQADENILYAVPFQVSALSMVVNNRQTDQWLFALHRKSGMPIRGAQITFWENHWDSKSRSYSYRNIGQTRTDEDGKASVAASRKNQQINGITIATPDDTLRTAGYFGTYGRYDEQPETHTRTFLFTDRAIYRPGQTIYFKGIVVANNTKENQNKVLADKKAEVTLYNTNNEKVTSLQLTTNAYGSFTGKFTAPASGLTGQMRIATENGDVYFSVEEYKRPRFEVLFDTLKTNIALNEVVTVKGRAQAYAGNNIDGAEVKYRVVRRARFPYFWTFYRWGQPQSDEMEITNGVVQTQADGTFEIPFTTLPDRKVNPETLPIFNYVVYADVTDINGETHSAMQTVNAGYRSLLLQAEIAPQIDARKDQRLPIRTQNLNGIATSANVGITVAPLQFPGKLYRKRLWEKPDQYVMTAAEFRQAFPDDEYADEADYLTWQRGETLWKTTLTTGGDTAATFPSSIWKGEGWHVIELTTTDAQGNHITEKQYTYVADPAEGARPQTALLIHANQTATMPGDTLDITVKTGFDSTYVVEINTDVAPEFTTFTQTRRIQRNVTEADRGGLAFSWLYVYNNRVYTASSDIAVPWSDRDLQLEWATHRDKLLPGEAEEWRITVKGNKKEAVAAELLAGLYDASLDALRPHNWYWERLLDIKRLDVYWNSQQGFGVSWGYPWQRNLDGDWPKGYEKVYDALYAVDFFNRYAYKRVAGVAGRVYGVAAPQLERAASNAAGHVEAEALEEVAVSGFATDSVADINAGIPHREQTGDDVGSPPPVRTNLQETAFFFPQLGTDAEGNVSVKFTMPEALTEWKLMAFAHTPDWKTGYLQGTVKTQKDLMVMPNLPRFLRQGDDIQISSKISNVSSQGLQGIARMEILDAATLEPIGDFGQTGTEQPFSVAENQSTTVAWMLHIPDDHFAPVVVRITAKAGNFTDGEENTLPVITNRMLVAETLPLPVRGNDSKVFTLPKLLHPESNTLTNHALTVEFTGNPAWYAVQALPYLMEYPYECAEQVFNRFYSNALATHIVDQSPKVKIIFDQWTKGDTTALLSNLEKNQELKSALLEETPWVMEAKQEGEQKRRIALLFEGHKLAQGLEQNLAKLAEMQLPDGSFPWFRGMASNRYITQYMVTGIVRLRHLGVEAAHSETANRILANAVDYLDRQIKADHDGLVKNKVQLEDRQIGPIQIQYLYARTFLTGMAIPKESRMAYNYYVTQASKYWTRFNPYLNGQIALALHRMGNAETPTEIIASLRETAIRSEEMGTYWKSMPRGYWWYEAPIEAQALLIETFAEVAKDHGMVDELKVWLLKQKQTQYWSTTKATADAIYALLLQGGDWLVNQPDVTIALGEETIRSAEENTEAGTGYFKKRFEGDAVSPEMGNITVRVDHAENEGVAWGAVYWQYFEDLDKITSSTGRQPAAETPLSLQKQLYIQRNTDRGPVLEEITADNALQVGDKVTVRIELRVDRDMEYVHLKDMRAACFEPINVLSGYRYQDGLGYYESTRDVATNFFFDYLRRGTYVFEYPVFVSQAGDFSNGISTIQCMYAPEFSSHSEGIRVKVVGGQ